MDLGLWGFAVDDRFTKVDQVRLVWKAAKIWQDRETAAAAASGAPADEEGDGNGGDALPGDRPPSPAPDSPPKPQNPNKGKRKADEPTGDLSPKRTKTATEAASEDKQPSPAYALGLDKHGKPRKPKQATCKSSEQLDLHIEASLTIV